MSKLFLPTIQGIHPANAPDCPSLADWRNVYKRDPNALFHRDRCYGSWIDRDVPGHWKAICHDGDSLYTGASGCRNANGYYGRHDAASCICDASKAAGGFPGS